MKFIKILTIMFISFSVISGCGKQNNLSVHEKEYANVPVSEENTIAEKTIRSDDSELIDALENSKISCGTIESNEVNTSIGFYVMDNKIDVSGTYCGESFESFLTDDKMEEFINEIANYSPKVQEKEYDYWPHTDEYPEMYVLFDYILLFDNGYKYRMDGAECYPDDWDDFIERLVKIIDL